MFTWKYIGTLQQRTACVMVWTQSYWTASSVQHISTAHGEHCHFMYLACARIVDVTPAVLASHATQQTTVLDADVSQPVTGCVTCREYILNLKEAPVPRASGKGIKRSIEQATGATSTSASAQAGPEAGAADPSARTSTAADTHVSAAEALQTAPSEASHDATAPAGHGTSPSGDVSIQAPDGAHAPGSATLTDAEQQAGIAAQAAGAAGSALQAGSDAVQSAVQVCAFCC